MEPVRAVNKLSEIVVRHTDHQRAVSALTRGTSVTLVGIPGIGKSFLAHAIVASLPRPEFTAVWIRASSGRSSVRWGAACAGFGLAAPAGADDGMIEARLDERLAQLAATSKRTPVIAVDDALLLDVYSAEWIGRVVRENHAVLLTCIEFGLKPTNEDRVIVSRVFQGLWTDGLSERLDLPRLDESATLRLTEVFGGENGLDLATQQYVAQHASGVPLLIRELVLDQLERASEGTVVASSDPHPAPAAARQSSLGQSAAPYTAPGPRTFDLSLGRIESLTPEQVEAVVSLAKLGSMPHRRAAQLVGSDLLAVLVRRGHVAPDPSAPDNSFALETDADSFAVVTPAKVMSPLVMHMMDTILEDHLSGLQMTSLEAQFVATHWQTASSTLMGYYEERFGNDIMSEVYLVAAAQANASGHAHKALVFSRTSDRIRPTARASVEMAKSLASMGRHESARAVLERTARQCTTQVDDLIWFRCASQMRGPQSPHKIELLLTSAVARYPNDPTFAAEGVLARLVTLGTAGNPVPELRDIADDDRVDVLTRVRACGSLALNAAFRGDAESVERALTVLRQLERTVVDDAYNNVALRDAMTISFAGACGAQILSRIGIDKLELQMQSRMSLSIRNQDYAHVAALSALRGVLAAATGDPVRAEREMRVAEERYTGTDPVGWKAWAACHYAAVLATLGRTDEAQSRLAEVKDLGDERMTWYFYAYQRALYETYVAAGHLDEARALALDLAENNAWSPTIQVQQLAAAAAVGAPIAAVASQAREAATTTTVPALHLTADLLEAQAQGDAAAVKALGDNLLDLRMLDVAKVAYNYAAARLDELGDKRGSREALARAEELVAPGTGRPAASVREVDLSALSAREREIADLIVAGNTNREIAQALFLSVRTVESHVYRLLRKLNLTSRRELIIESVVVG
jgi:DNA-binding CsgD family transcriptional regulator